MRIPFDIKYRPQIESGEYKVETRDGTPIRIICFDAPIRNYPIIGISDDPESDPFTFTIDGRYIFEPANQDSLDLFIIIPEPELTEFEQELVNFFNERNAMLPDKDGVYNKHDCDELLHKSASKLLDLAKKEICKGCTVGLDQYWKGREDARKEYEKSVTFHYPSYPTY